MAALEILKVAYHTNKKKNSCNIGFGNADDNGLDGGSLDSSDSHSQSDSK